MKVRRKRMVMLTVDTIGELMKDYLGTTLPRDAWPVRLEFNPQENGKLAVVYESESIPHDAKNIFVHFDLKRTFMVGGSDA